MFTHADVVSAQTWEVSLLKIQSSHLQPVKEAYIKVARLDFLGGYLPSLSINYVAMSKDMGKRLPELS